ncbi:MAG: superoxide dismutase [Candidatus Zixiibacteriota bacterium]|nr:MAG: superoxide dismutase [candidate division Zixibacteria bacterium]
MKASLTALVAVMLLMLGSAPAAYAHCEIPCGIYDDQLRISLLKENITTIEKSMAEITRLAAAGEKNYNQLIRWVNNKEQHAGRFMEIVAQYFMTQRLKPADPSDGEVYLKYQAQLSLLHRMLFYAMKCKQTTASEHTTTLRKLVDEFADLYFESGS